MQQNTIKCHDHNIQNDMTKKYKINTIICLNVIALIQRCYFLKQELLSSLEGDVGQAEISRFAQKKLPVKGKEHQGAPGGSPHCRSVLLQNTCCHACACMLSRVPFFATPWTITLQTLLSMEFSRQEHWSGLPFPTPGPDMPKHYPTRPQSLQ